MKFNLIFLLLFVAVQSQSAEIKQTKGNSAIIELNEEEIDNLKLSIGENIILTINEESYLANITSKKNSKLLIKANRDLTGTKNSFAEITKKTNRATGKSQGSNQQQKKIIYGVNAKYITGTASIKYADTVVGSLTVPGASITQNYSGFNLSASGFYYYDQIGIGAEAEYSSLSGTGSNITSTITQMQINALAEYRYQKFSVGGLITLASNYKSTDSAKNDTSLNGMGGFGVFATYQVIPAVRAILEYRTMNYKLDSNSVNTSDIRLGAGYFF